MTIADLREKLGGIPPKRVSLTPPPGTATEKDVVTIQAHEKRNCELVNGVVGDVLPGLSLPKREVFSRLEEKPSRKPRTKR